MKKQHVYSFAKGDGQDKKLLGGKGANLCEMTQIGINVPPGFVITTEACLDYLERNALPDSLMASVKEEIGNLEVDTGKTFGTGSDPLLVSVRSGSAMSMPGMMDTILKRKDARQSDSKNRRRALCLRRLSAFHPAIWQGGAWHRRRKIRCAFRGDQKARRR